jgi:hypothetical protein
MSSNLWLKTAGGMVEVGGAVQGRPIEVWRTWLTQNIQVGTTSPDIGVGTEIQIPAVDYDRTLVINVTATIVWEVGGTVLGRVVRCYARLNNNTNLTPWASSAAVGQTNSSNESHEATTVYNLAADTPLQIDLAASKNGGSENLIVANHSGLTVTAYPAAVAPSGIEEPDPVPAWITLPLTTDFEAYPNFGLPQYRLVGDMVQLRGLVRSINVQATGVAVAISDPLPAAYTAPRRYIIGTKQSQKPGAEIRTTTHSIIEWRNDVSGLAVGSWVTLDNLSYSVTP